MAGRLCVITPWQLTGNAFPGLFPLSCFFLSFLFGQMQLQPCRVCMYLLTYAVRDTGSTGPPGPATFGERSYIDRSGWACTAMYIYMAYLRQVMVQTDTGTRDLAACQSLQACSQPIKTSSHSLCLRGVWGVSCLDWDLTTST